MRVILLYISLFLVSFSVMAQEVYTAVGTGVSGYSGDGGDATNAEISSPYTLTIDEDNNLYIADQGNSCVRKVDAVTNEITTLFSQSTPNVTPTFSANYIEYYDNKVFFVDNYDLKAFDLTSLSVSTIYSFTTTPITTFVVKGDTVFAVTNSTEIILLADIYGNPNLTTGYSSSTSSYYSHTYSIITDLLIDDDGNLIVLNVVSAGTGSEVVKLNSSTQQAEVMGASINMPFPEGFAMDSYGDIYIADQSANKIFILSSGNIWTYAGTGVNGYYDTTVGNAQFDAPVKIGIDNNNRIYVSDYNNNVVRAIGCNYANGPDIEMVDFYDLDNFDYLDDEDDCFDTGDSIYFYIKNGSNDLNDNTNWFWYSNSCGGDLIGTGDTLYFDPYQNQDIYVRGEGGCIEFGDCSEIIYDQFICVDNNSFKVENNSFTPNDDGINDSWVIDSIPTGAIVSIYNRWGDLVREISDYDNIEQVWIGKNELDVDVVSGTYFYVIQVNEELISSGWVQVVK
ncbi:MAG: T9SS type B sorting domain-containing protein [Putridiphycobacter sp.]